MRYMGGQSGMTSSMNSMAYIPYTPSNTFPIPILFSPRFYRIYAVPLALALAGKKFPSSHFYGTASRASTASDIRHPLSLDSHSPLLHTAYT